MDCLNDLACCQFLCRDSLPGLLSETVPKKPYDKGKMFLLTTKATRYFKKTKKQKWYARDCVKGFLHLVARISCQGNLSGIFYGGSLWEKAKSQKPRR